MINNNWHRPGKLKKQNPEVNFVLLNQKGAYPIGPADIEKFYTKTDDEIIKLLKDSNILGFHWFAGHPSSQKFESELSENNIDQYDNILSTAIKLLRKNK